MLPRPPTNWRDTSGWDSYWQATISGNPKFLRHDMHTPMGFLWVRNLRDSLWARGKTTLLFVGNGISLTPHAFALAGFATVALDVSAVASEYLHRQEIETRDLLHFFQGPGIPADVTLEKSRVAGGSVDVVCGDVFDVTVARGPFDVIFSERSLQGFSPDDLELAVRAIDARMNRPGECHVMIQNSGDSRSQIVSEFEGLGYLNCTLGEVAPSSSLKVLYAAIGSG